MHKYAALIVLFTFCLNYSKGQLNKSIYKTISQRPAEDLLELCFSLSSEIEKSPGKAQLYFDRSVLREALHDTLGSIHDVEAALKINNSEPDFHYMYARGLYDTKRYTEVIKECEIAIAGNTLFAQPYVLMGNAHDLTGNAEKAMACFEKAIAIDATYEDAYIQLAISYALKKDYASEEKILNKLLSHVPECAEAYNTLAKMCVYSKNFQKAIMYSDKLLKTGKLTGQAWLIKALANDSLKNTKEACDCMLPAFKNGFDDGYTYIMKNCADLQNVKEIKNQTLLNKALEEERKRNYTEALKIYDQLISLVPDKPVPYYNRGKVKRAQENHAEAIKDYRKAISKDRKFCEPYVAMGVSFTYLNQLDSAKNYYLKAINIQPLYEKSYYNYADIMKEEKNYSAAVEYYKKAIAIKPNYIMGYMGLGESYGKLGLKKEACESYRAAEKLGETKAITQRIWFCN